MVSLHPAIRFYVWKKTFKLGQILISGKMDVPKLTKDFFIERRRLLLEQLPDDALVFAVSADQLPRNGDQTFRFRQNSDLFYLTGISQEQTILALAPNHPNPKLREALFIRRTSPEIEKWEGHKLTKDEAKEISGVENIYWYDQFEGFLPDYMFYVQDVYISINENHGYKRFYDDSEMRFINRLKFLYPLHTYRRLGQILVPMRMKKTEEELGVIKYAIDLTAKAFDRVLKFMRPGVKEYEVEAEIIHEFWRHGVRTVAYESIIASGKNACTLHYIYNNSVCESGQLVLMDFGAEYLNYAADLTRTIPVDGRFSPRQRDVYQAVLDVQRTMMKEYIKPGITINELNDKSRDLIGERLVDLGLLTNEDLQKPREEKEKAIKKYYPHGLSHFMGLDVHDVGNKFIPLEPGMIITVEPGIYIDDEGLGIRLENDVLITEDGNTDLMENIPLDMDLLEDLMKK